MNREILFRGKSPITRNWVTGDLFQHGEQRFIMHDNRNTEVITETVGEYTGLTDKKGKKIFEGDIVEFQDGVPDDIYNEIEITNRGVISFSSGQFYVTDRYVADMNDLIFNDTDFDGEVVGNVHDNLELLKGD